MSNNVKLNKTGFLASMYEKLYHNKGIRKISKGDDIVIPEKFIYEFMHDLGILIEQSIQENSTLDK
jgi:hypothetical protein